MNSRILRPLLSLVAFTVTIPIASGQSPGQYHPLSQRTPLGQTAAWLRHIHGGQDDWRQPLVFQVDGGAEVAVFSAGPQPVAVVDDSTLVAVTPRHTYRLRLANMPEFPGVELFPTIEVLDRLHPPAGQADRYPVPVTFSRYDIQQALAGALVTRVIYLEDPETAQLTDPLHREFPQEVTPAENVLQRADQLGRPMIIIRLGNRRPSPSSSSPLTWGTGGVVQMRERPADQPAGAIQ